MKSRKCLKKKMKKNFNELYQEIFFYELFAVNANGDKAKMLLNEILAIESDLLKRISVREGKHVKGRVKMYFSKLNEDLQKHLQGFRKKIEELER